jgi:putative hemolysin
MKLGPVIALVVGILLVVACGGQPSLVPTPTTFDSPLGLPNPASVFCEEQGYTLELRTSAEGTAGICIFPDGSECEEWAFYRGECQPGGILGMGRAQPAAEGATPRRVDARKSCRCQSVRSQRAILDSLAPQWRHHHM